MKNEVLTKRKVVKRYNYYNTFYNASSIDYYSNYNSIYRKAVDVAVIIKPLNGLININEYMKQLVDDINLKIDNLEIEAINSFRKHKGLKIEDKPLEYYKKEIYKLCLYDDKFLLLSPTKGKLNKKMIKSFREINTSKEILKHGYCNTYGAVDCYYFKNGNKNIICEDIDLTLLATRTLNS